MVQLPIAAIVWSAAAHAGDLADLDAVTGWGPIAWESAPRASMLRRGGNGPGRDQYVIPSDINSVGAYNADAITYEYIGGKLGTVIQAFQHQVDAEGVLADLIDAYGAPTSEDAVTFTKVWRGERVRLVYRQQSTDLWVVTYAWLPLHTADVLPPSEAAPKAPPPPVTDLPGFDSPISGSLLLPQPKPQENPPKTP